METEVSISVKELAKKFGQPVRPSEVNISEYQGIVRRGVLLATAKNGQGQEIMLVLRDPKVFGETIELWKGSFYRDLELRFVANDRRAAFACDFIRLYGRAEEVKKNPLKFKGLDWSGEAYWVAIANDAQNSLQGELFPDSRQEAIPLNIGDKEIFTTFRKASDQGRLEGLTFYKITKNQGEQFRSIYPWWAQKALLEQLDQTKAAQPPPAERLENTG